MNEDIKGKLIKKIGLKFDKFVLIYFNNQSDQFK